MKTFLHIFIAIMATAAVFVIGHSCYHHSSQKDDVTVCPDSVVLTSIPLDSIFELEGNEIVIKMMCEQDLWLNTEGIEINTPLLSDLVDLYNAFTAIRSIFTDFDLVMRNEDFAPDAKEAIKALDLAVIADQETREFVMDYKQKMLALFDAKPNAVNQEEVNPYLYRDEADALVGQKYLITHYCGLELDALKEQLNDAFWNNPDVPDWDDLQDRRGDVSIEPDLRYRFSQSKTTDEQCIYLMELAHVHVAARYADQSPYPGLIYKMLTSGQYSKYLLHLWVSWRCICQIELGSSKDSYIPNWIYNQVRNQCARAMLAYIAQHPSDIMAINILMQMSSEQNIYREGTYGHGNQNAIDFYCLFHEQFEGEEEDEEEGE